MPFYQKCKKNILYKSSERASFIIPADNVIDYFSVAFVSVSFIRTLYNKVFRVELKGQETVTVTQQLTAVMLHLKTVIRFVVNLHKSSTKCLHVLRTLSFPWYSLFFITLYCFYRLTKMAPELLNRKLSTAAFLQNHQSETEQTTFLPSSQSVTFGWTDNKMLQSDSQYTKLRWLLTIAGLFLYVVDIWTDVALALKYFQQNHFVWAGLTLVFVLAGLLVTQIFSYAWYTDDMSAALINAEVKPTISGLSKGRLAVLHLFGVGIFTRYDCNKSAALFYICKFTQAAHVAYNKDCYQTI